MKRMKERFSYRVQKNLEQLNDRGTFGIGLGKTEKFNYLV